MVHCQWRATIYCISVQDYSMDNVLKKNWKQNCGTKNYKHNHVVYTPLSYELWQKLFVIAINHKHPMPQRHGNE